MNRTVISDKKLDELCTHLKILWVNGINYTPIRQRRRMQLFLLHSRQASLFQSAQFKHTHFTKDQFSYKSLFFRITISTWWRWDQLIKHPIFRPHSYFFSLRSKRKPWKFRGLHIWEKKEINRTSRWHW